MFTNNKAKYFGENKVLIDAACLSGDTKPTTGVANGSMTLEMDTGKLYAFDEANSEWLALSSGGGGGGGAEPLIVNVTQNESVYTTDKTWAEIKNALTAGKNCIFHWEDNLPYNANSYGVVSGIDQAVSDEQWTVYVGYFGSSAQFTAYAEDGYLEYSAG